MRVGKNRGGRWPAGGPMLAAASPAFAESGMGTAMGGMLLLLTMYPVFFGLCLGLVCARFPRCTVPSCILVALPLGALAITFPPAAPFALLSGIVFALVFSAVRYQFAGSATALPPAAAAGSAGILRWVAATYVFWAGISLFNVELLLFLPVPIALVAMPELVTDYLPFVLPPLALALAVSALATAQARKRAWIAGRWTPLFFNACLLVSFLVAADLYRYRLMSQSVHVRLGGKFESSSFLDSVLDYGDVSRNPHAYLTLDGQLYHWSYVRRAFVLE